jgi:hypothetical protein
MSGTGTLNTSPKSRPTASCLGIWSSDAAENTFGDPRAAARSSTYSTIPVRCTVGLPMSSPVDAGP